MSILENPYLRGLEELLRKKPKAPWQDNGHDTLGYKEAEYNNKIIELVKQLNDAKQKLEDHSTVVNYSVAEGTATKALEGKVKLAKAAFEETKEIFEVELNNKIKELSTACETERELSLKLVESKYQEALLSAKAIYEKGVQQIQVEYEKTKNSITADAMKKLTNRRRSLECKQRIFEECQHKLQTTILEIESKSLPKPVILARETVKVATVEKEYLEDCRKICDLYKGVFHHKTLTIENGKLVRDEEYLVDSETGDYGIRKFTIKPELVKWFYDTLMVSPTVPNIPTATPIKKCLKIKKPVKEAVDNKFTELDKDEDEYREQLVKDGQAVMNTMNWSCKDCGWKPRIITMLENHCGVCKNCVAI